MKISVVTVCLHSREVFRTAHGAGSSSETVLVRLDEQGVVGYGEAKPTSLYGENAPSVARALLGLRPFLAGLKIKSREDIAEVWEQAWKWLAPSRAAQCALDVALRDWWARSRGRKLTQEFEFGPPQLLSFATIGLCEREEFAQRLERWQNFPAWKIKDDGQGKSWRWEMIAKAHPLSWAVDANGSWRESTLGAGSEILQRCGAAFLEQPLPRGQDFALQPGKYALPLLADESCIEESQVQEVLQRYDGFNVKLVKCGGLTPALRMLAKGKEAGAITMVGCMLESSLLISAGWIAARHSSYADLDGAWLLANDPCPGMTWQEGWLHLGTEDGFGVAPRGEFHWQQA